MRKTWLATTTLSLALAGSAHAETASTGKAREAGFTTCAPLVEAMGKHASGENPHYALATWKNTETDERPFNSQVITKFSDGHSVSVLNVVPSKPAKCDGALTQVFYTATSCNVTRETTYKDWKFSSEGAGLVILENESGTVNAVLMPAGEGCVAVKTEVLYGWQEG